MPNVTPHHSCASACKAQAAEVPRRTCTLAMARETALESRALVPRLCSAPSSLPRLPDARECGARPASSTSVPASAQKQPKQTEQLHSLGTILAKVTQQRPLHAARQVAAHTFFISRGTGHNLTALGTESTFQTAPCQAKVGAQLPFEPGQKVRCSNVWEEAYAALWHCKQSPAPHVAVSHSALLLHTTDIACRRTMTASTQPPARRNEVLPWFRLRHGARACVLSML